MGILSKLNERRVLPWLGAYLAGGYLVLEGVDQLVGNGILPALAWRITFIFYVSGVPATLILAWFHGKKGPQKPPATEVWLLIGLLLVAVGVSGAVTRNYLLAERSAALVAGSGLEADDVAVLYFEDLSSDGGLGYLADGLTEALIDNLSQVTALHVISRNGVAPFRSSDVPRDSIARALNVGTLIAGSVEPVGDRVRVTVRLVEGASAADFERRSFDLPRENLLAIRDSVAANVATFMRRRLGDEVEMRERRAGTSSVDAWGLVQRGERVRKQAEELVHEDIESALSRYEQADSLFALAEASDPAWPEPIVMRARIAYERARLYDTDPHEAEPWIDSGLTHAERAVALAPNNSEALEMRGTLRYLQWLHDLIPNLEESEAAFDLARQDLERAVQVDPSNAGAYRIVSHLYSQTGDLVEVAVAAQRAYQADAYMRDIETIIYRLFTVSYDLEQQREATRWCQEGRERFEHQTQFVVCKLMLLVMPPTEPDVEEAWQLAEQLTQLSPEHEREYQQSLAEMYVGGTLARAGLADSARAVLERARLDQHADPTRSLARVEAYMRVLLGEHDEAIELLRQYVGARAAGFHGTEEHGTEFWWWEDLADDPRYQRLMGRSG